MLKKLQPFILSWDTFFAIIAAAICISTLPANLESKFCISIYSTAISVLSIIFSIFFASLAVIMSFPDNEFIRFIEKPDKLFTKLVIFFKITLMALFVALLYTIIVYMVTSFEHYDPANNKTLFTIFVFMFTYGLFATAIAVMTTLQITIGRASFLAGKEEDDDNEEN